MMTTLLARRSQEHQATLGRPRQHLGSETRSACAWARHFVAQGADAFTARSKHWPCSTAR